MKKQISMPSGLSGIKATVYFCFFLLAVAVNLSWLFYPAYFPQFKKTAAIIVKQKRIQAALSRLNRQYPQLSLQERDKLLAEVRRQEKTDRKLLKNQIDRTYKELKAPYQNNFGQTYLLEVDPYAWLRATRLVLERGYPGSSKIGRIVYDNFMLAPEGGQVQAQQFLFYSAAWLYRLGKTIVGRMSLETFLFYLPIFFAAIFFIVLYYFCSYFFSRASGILAVLLIGFSSIFIVRSCAGRFDSDVLSLVLPLALIWLLAVGLKAKDYRKTALFSLAAGFVLSLFAFTWAAWWFILLVTLLFYLYYPLRSRGKVQTTIISAAIFFISSEFFCLTLLGFELFSQAVFEIIRNIGIAVPASVSLWPNVYWLVSELLPLNVHSMVISSGNIIVLCVYALSIVWVVFSQRRSENHPITMLLLLWLLVMGFLSYWAQRFIFFTMVPASIFLGVGLAELTARIIDSLSGHRQFVRKCIVAISYLLLTVGLAQVFYRDAVLAAASSRPMLTDDYYDLLQLLRKQTPSESIINTWWDYGNWVKEIAKRRVLFDPQSQNRPIAYWLAQALCTDNEEMSARILRMLNNSSDRLFYDMQAELNDELKCINILKEVLKAERSEICGILQAYGLSEGLQAQIQEAVFEKEPAPAYLVLDRAMLGKISSISYLANWDFNKAYSLSHGHKPAVPIIAEMFKVKAGREKREVLSQRWLFNPPLGKSNDRGNSVHFSNGIVFERDTLISRIFSLPEKKFKTFKTTFFFDGENFATHCYPEADLPGGVLIIRAGDKWQSIGFSDQALGLSMFSRLFFMKAEGLRHFELCFANDEAGMYVYEIKW